MNAVEIEEAVSELASAPFDAAEFPYAFLAAFGNKATAIARLKSGSTNASDVPGGVLQRNHIHLATCAPGKVSETLAALKASSRMAKAKCKFVLATDGELLEAEELATGEALACAYGDVANHFGFFLPLAGITTVAEVKDNPIDIKATGRLNKLYVELIKENPDWDTEKRRHDLNQFMARLIFCFFAEDTGIFFGNGLFTQTVRQMSDAKNTHDVIRELFRAMDIPIEKREAAKLRPWADAFPFVNGGLFAGTRDVPTFSQFARTYLLRVGELDWKHINPDIFGSMIQGIADDDERGSLGMHYTSVPNILKVLDPLFLDDLREKLDEAGDNPRKLLNLRKRIANIRVFDPACGSGNFLVIAYIKLREIEAEIIRRRNDEKKSWIPLTNFYGIELKDFACETARLSLLIAEFQCDARLIGQREACLNVLPLKKTGQVHCGNALRKDWLEVCPPGPAPAIEHDLAGPTGRLALEDQLVKPALSETYICGNPPYLGKGKKGEVHQDDMAAVLGGRLAQWGYVDYVGCWFVLAADYCRVTGSKAALVATNSLCQGRQLPQLWPEILRDGVEIGFAHLSFKWSNNASQNAGVTCVIIGLRPYVAAKKVIYTNELARIVENINAYLLNGPDEFVESRPSHINSQLPQMMTGSVPNDGGHLIMSPDVARELVRNEPRCQSWLLRFAGSQDFIQGLERRCLYIPDEDAAAARDIPAIVERLDAVRELRLESPKRETRELLAAVPHRFQHRAGRAKSHAIIVPSVSSESREWFPAGLVGSDTIISNLAFMILDADAWVLSLIASRMHLVWVATVCGKLKTDFRYSNTLGWNTFPVPKLTEQNRVDLTQCAEEILLAREAHFPATVAELYDPDSMPENLRRAHESNDETLERIYIGRRFKNDTERLEKLFDLYTKMTADTPVKRGAAQA